MPALLTTAACCIALRFEWDGRPLQAGRRPIHGVEVPNVRPSRAEPPGARPSILYPLSPASPRDLARLAPDGQALEVVLEPPLPPGPGDLRVRIELVAGGRPGGPPTPPLPPGQGFRATLSRPDDGATGVTAAAPLRADGDLLEGTPLELVLSLPAMTGPEERLELVLSSTSDPEERLRLAWSRSRAPGQERFTWTEAPVPARARGGEPAGEAPRGWLDYQAAWELAGGATSAAHLDRLLQEAQRLEEGLAPLVDAPLRADLIALLRTRATDRRAAVAPARGEPPGPDHAAALRASTEGLDRAARVIDRLRSLGWPAGWIEARLAPYATLLLEVVEAQALQVERTQGRATAQVVGARALLARVGPRLGRPPGTTAR